MIESNKIKFNTQFSERMAKADQIYQRTLESPDKNHALDYKEKIRNYDKTAHTTRVSFFANLGEDKQILKQKELAVSHYDSNRNHAEFLKSNE